MPANTFEHVHEPAAVDRAIPTGVGFVDFSDDIGDTYDDDDDDMDYIPSREELLAGDQIDPDTLLTEEDRQKPIIIRKCSDMPYHLGLVLILNLNSRGVQAEWETETGV